jgi:hypothetical protein
VCLLTSSDVLNSHVINYAVRLNRRDEPHPHYRGAGLLSAEQLAELNRTAPAADQFERFDQSTGNVRRRYRLSALTLLDEDKGVTPPLEVLSPPWQAFVAEFLSARMDDWISRETGFDGTGMRRTSSIFLHRDGDFQDLSTGKLHKKMHIEFHLNAEWPADGGGEWEFWSGPDRSAGPHSTMLPIGGTCLLYSPSERTWHQMAPVAEGRGLSRLWVSLSYFV